MNNLKNLYPWRKRFLKKFDTSLYFITDSTDYAEEEFLYRIERALMGGVTMLQLREKNRTTREYITLAEKVHELTKQYAVPLIIDDRADVVLAMDAEGVHLGAEDMTIEAARKILGDGKIIGATAKTVPWALDVYRQGADYLGVGAIYPTTTKVKTVLTSPDTLREICRAVPIPVNAIGGLNKDNLAVLAGIPIAGICAVSAIMKADDPKTAAEELQTSAKELALI
ncbi:MAG: thiamine phosphate synthase [Clostridia bacterium]|nr:thiamine phosphate synthase [Clostridia bacterium]